MVVIRILALVGVFFLAGCTLMYMFTRDRRYLKLVDKAARVFLVIALFVLALFFLERLL